MPCMVNLSAHTPHEPFSNIKQTNFISSVLFSSSLSPPNGMSAPTQKLNRGMTGGNGRLLPGRERWDSAQVKDPSG